MLEYIMIDTYIFMTNDTVKIWIKDGKVHYSVDTILTKGVVIEDAISDITPEELNAAIESFDIPSWKRNYEPKGIILDGETWNVKYKLEGQKVIKRSGENAWPPCWKKLLQFVKSVTGEIGEMY